MTAYVARRLLLAIPTLFGVVTIVFIIMRIIPGDPAETLAGTLATEENLARIRESLGLNDPLYVQYLRFIGGLLQGDLGESAVSRLPVWRDLSARLPYTLALTFGGMLIAMVVGIVAGVVAALRRNTWLDLVISGGAVLGISMPVFWLGMMLIIVFSVNFNIFPAGGARGLSSFILPSVALATVPLGIIARMTRSSMLEVLGLDFIRTARAKGAGRVRVVARHAFRNALIPVLTVIGLQFGALLGGAVLTETVFSWPGVGRLLVGAILSRDYAVVQAIVLLFSASFILVNLIVDVTYSYIDRRITYA